MFPPLLTPLKIARGLGLFKIEKRKCTLHYFTNLERNNKKRKKEKKADKQFVFVFIELLVLITFLELENSICLITFKIHQPFPQYELCSLHWLFQQRWLRFSSTQPILNDAEDIDSCESSKAFVA